MQALRFFSRLISAAMLIAISARTWLPMDTPTGARLRVTGITKQTNDLFSHGLIGILAAILDEYGNGIY